MVRSIDVQQVLMQSNAVERVQQVQQQQGDAQQRYFHARQIEEERKLREKVKNSQEADQLTVRPEDERKKGEGKRENGDTRGKQDKNTADTGESEGTIDIRV